MTDPKSLPAYNDSVRHAIARAFRDREGSFMIYADDSTVYVRDSAAAKPLGVQIIHAVQFWSSDGKNATVQIRSSGAHSDWVTLPEPADGYDNLP